MRSAQCIVLHVSSTWELCYGQLLQWLNGRMMRFAPCAPERSAECCE